MRLNKDHIFAIMATVCLYAVAVIYIPTSQLRVSYIFLMQLSTILLLSTIIILKINKWIGFFLLFIFWSSLYPQSSPLSMEAFKNVLFAILFYSLLVLFLKKSYWNYILNAFCLIALIHTIILVFCLSMI